jgi:hypothetical protein
MTTSMSTRIAAGVTAAYLRDLTRRSEPTAAPEAPRDKIPIARQPPETGASFDRTAIRHGDHRLGGGLGKGVGLRSAVITAAGAPATPRAAGRHRRPTRRRP